MANTDRERTYVASLYPGKGWKDRVKKMSDAQILAIYFKKKQGEKTLKESKESNPDVEPF